MKAFLLIAFIAIASAAEDPCAALTGTACEASTCFWKGNVCKTCEGATEAECNLAKNCFWGKDKNKGTAEETKAKCYSDDGCEKMEDEGTCIDAIGCGYLKEFWAAEDKAEPACKKCSEMNNKKYDCVRFHGCKWAGANDAAGLCVSSKIEEATCAEITVSNKCERAFHLGCEWTKDGACVAYEAKGPTTFCEKFNGDTCPASCRRGKDGETAIGCVACSSIVKADFATKCKAEFGCQVNLYNLGVCEPITGPVQCGDKTTEATCKKNPDDEDTTCSWCTVTDAPAARKNTCYATALDAGTPKWCGPQPDPETPKKSCKELFTSSTTCAVDTKNENNVPCTWCPLTGTCEETCLTCKQMYESTACKKVKVAEKPANVKEADNVDCLWCAINSYCIDDAETKADPKTNGCYESCELATYAQCETADQAKGHCKGCKFDDFCTEKTTREAVCTATSECDGKAKDVCTADENTKCQWCEESATSKANYCAPKADTCDYKCSAVKTKPACDSRDDKCAYCEFDAYCGDKGAKCTINCDKQLDETKCKAETSCNWQEDKEDAAKSKCVKKSGAARVVASAMAFVVVALALLL